MAIDLVSIVTLLALGSYAAASIGPPIANTTSGLLIGVPSDGINVFTGIRFAEAPIGPLRWEPPVPFRSSRAQNATSFGPSCLQTFPFQTRDFFMNIFNTPGPITGENEDCLFLNVWAPASSAGLKPVLVWIYGGALEWGASSLPLYDGLSIAKQQDIVFVTFNYRTNVFGFPASPDLPIAQNNLGYLDQELLFGWIQSNIGAFGGDKSKVTIMGWSAGSVSVADAVVRHNADTAPFRAGIMVSSATSSLNPEPNIGPFNEFATAMNCTQPAGSAARLACLKKIPAEVISNYTNGPDSGAFTFSTTIVADNVTKFTDPFERIRKGNSAQTPVLLGAVENEGTFRAANVTDLANSTAALLPPARTLVTAEELLALYPNQTAMEIAANATRDDVMRCSDSLFAKALFDSGITSVFRYTYGALFPDTQPFPGAGVWHGADLPIIFGTFNKTTATQAEAELSRSFQTAIGNFVKDPFSSPAPNWLPYVPGNRTKTLARIAYHGNVAMHNFIDPAISDSIDGNCATFWNQFLDFTSS